MVVALGLRETLANQLRLFISQGPFEPTDAECRQQLTEIPVAQPSENRTPFELTGMNEKRCDSKQEPTAETMMGLF